MIDGFDAIVLAGGRGSRLGVARKPELVIGGRRLLDIALAAVADARQVVVVGDVEVPPHVLRTREEPPFGGPVAGVAAGYVALPAHAPWTVLLACDLPGAEAAVQRLLTRTLGRGGDRGRDGSDGAGRAGDDAVADEEPVADDEAVDGVCLMDGDGRLQWLLGCYRTARLGRRLAERGEPPITAMYRLLEPLNLLGVPAAGVRVDDVDTPEDVTRWREGQL